MKETRKQIVAQVTNKLNSKFNAEREYQRERYSKLWVAYETEVKKRQDLQDENIKLRDKIEQYEDWIHRLQEFVNMPDGTREREFKVYMDELKSREHLQEIEKMFRMFTSHLF